MPRPAAVLETLERVVLARRVERLPPGWKLARSQPHSPILPETFR
jgi:hypothetical protein